MQSRGDASRIGQDIIQFVVRRFGSLEEVVDGDLFDLDWVKTRQDKVVRSCSCSERRIIGTVVHAGVDSCGLMCCCL